MRTILGKNENNHAGTRVSNASIVDGIRDEISDGFSDSIALPEDRPTRSVIDNALWLIGIIEELGDKRDGELLRGLQAWPSNNCTIELGDRVSAGTQYILEAGSNGVSGFVRTGGDTVHIGPTSSVSAIKPLLAEWYEVASGMRAERCANAAKSG